MRLHRLIAILLLIESRGQMKAKELAYALETSVRTVYRDIETLCQAGIPIATTTGPNGGVCFMEGYTTKLYNLQEEEAVNLYLTGATVYKGDTGKNLKYALSNLEKMLPAEYSEDIKLAKDRFYFDEYPWWDKKPELHHMDVLRKSVWNTKKLRVKYRKINNEISARELLPYGLVVKAMEWYLVAFCTISNSIRTFKCERIIEAEIIDSTFQIQNDFNLERYWKESEKMFKNICSENEQYHVLLKLCKSHSDILKKCEVLKTYEKDEYIFAEINMHKFEYACREVDEIIWDTEILSPIELRNFVKNKVEAVIKKYEHR